MALKLSILIPTTTSREKVIRGLLRNLNRQIAKYPTEVELLINGHETDNVGKKRNDLLMQAKGTHCVFIDSDDQVSSDYVKLILKALKSDPDCVGISGIITTNGKNARQWHISKEYGTWYTKGRVYMRTPNHISPIRTELARKVMFPEISHGEDAVFSRNIHPLLKSEVIIKGNIYHYIFKSKK